MAARAGLQTQVAGEACPAAQAGTVAATPPRSRRHVPAGNLVRAGGFPARRDGFAASVARSRIGGENRQQKNRPLRPAPPMKEAGSEFRGFRRDSQRTLGAIAPNPPHRLTHSPTHNSRTPLPRQSPMTNVAADVLLTSARSVVKNLFSVPFSRRPRRPRLEMSFFGAWKAYSAVKRS